MGIVIALVWSSLMGHVSLLRGAHSAAGGLSQLTMPAEGRKTNKSRARERERERAKKRVSVCLFFCLLAGCTPGGHAATRF